MIERIPFIKLVFPNSIEKKYVIDKDSASAMFNKINELVDKANEFEKLIQECKEIDERKVSKFAKYCNELGKEKEPKFGEWVSVKDRLPDIFGNYLTCDDHGNFHVFFYCETQPYPFNIKKDDPKYYQPTHWMPLPKLPKEEGAEK